ncbi:type II toxin-antitoxin system HicB family antitoxin [Haloarcula sp. JP-L23]|uniref:type II toxin-antitoxin system HicB family antitoxin n=1 Tax=Haloarcula sp. JP-L23 TaxID=2716717 RepID=UPI00140EC576|nr:type II toxin-antitoxin system HicB family antitoxin [Haloarcula sp. JP-L23]
MSSGREIRLLENDDGWWTVRDVEAEVSSQGPTKTEALENLEEAVALAAGDIGRPPTDDELRELGVDPEEARSSDGDLPDVLK